MVLEAVKPHYQALETIKPNFQEAIQAALDCLNVCESCASTCLQDDEASVLTRCIHLSWECAAVCDGMTKSLLGGSKYAQDWVLLCIEVCEDCAAECERHDHPCCRACAEACRACARVCSELLLTLA